MRDIEHVVQDRDEPARALLDRHHVVALPGVEVRPEQELRGADDTVHGRAQLVAHVPEEGDLRFAGHVGGTALLLERDRRLAEQLCLPLLLEHADDMPPEDPHRVVLLARELAWLAIERAECADGQTVASDERRACVEANLRAVGHERAVGEACVRAGIRDDEELLLLDGPLAEGDVSAGSLGR